MQTMWLHRFTVLLAVLTLFLVVAGASVTSNEAGLSVPDWPLSYGKVMPEMTGGVFYEHGHRMVGATVGFLTIILAVWLTMSDGRSWMRRLGWAALAAVVVQGVLGGLTVIFLLPPAISVSHACLAQLFFSLTVAIALFTSRSWQAGPEMVEDSGTPSMRTLAVITPIALLAQVALGAAYRHRALGVAPHVVGALVVTGIVLMAAMFALQQFPQHSGLRNACLSLAVVALVQVFFFNDAYMSGIYASGSVQSVWAMVLFTVLHVAVGSLTMASSVVFAIQVRRNVREAAPAGGVPVTL